MSAGLSRRALIQQVAGLGALAALGSHCGPFATAPSATQRKYRIGHLTGRLARAGGLVGYGPNFRAVYRRAAAYVDKILMGAAPADLPVERSSAFELVVNRRALTDLSLTVPPAVAPLVTEWVD